MADKYDVVIIGAAATGSAIAYFLAANPDFDGSVLLVERDPTFARAATSLSASAIRSQFSTPLNVQISRFSHRFMMDFAETMQIDGQRPQLNFHPGGYLFLARTPAQAEMLRLNHAVQVANGADVVLWDGAQTADAFPHLNTQDVVLASYGRSGEGWFDNTALMGGFRDKPGAVHRVLHRPVRYHTADGRHHAGQGPPGSQFLCVDARGARLCTVVELRQGSAGRRGSVGHDVGFAN